MNKKLKIAIIVVIIAIVAFLAIYLVVNNNKKNLQNNPVDNQNVESGENMDTTMNAIVLRVNEDSLDVMIGSDEEKYVNNVVFSKEGNSGFKEGQEILIYYNSNSESVIPGQILDVGKIEIVKEESGVTIPDEIKQIFQNDDNNIEE